MFVQRDGRPSGSPTRIHQREGFEEGEFESNELRQSPYQGRNNNVNPAPVRSVP